MYGNRKLEIIGFTILCIVLNLNGYVGQPRRGNRNSGRRNNQNSQSNHPEAELPGNLQTAYLNAVDQQQPSDDVPTTTVISMTPESQRRGSQTRNAWNQFAPSIPSLEDSDCYVSVERYQRGRCTQLGGAGDNRPYICQSGERFEFQSDCERKILRRNQRNKK